jgi:hypothetical protein
MPAPELPTSPLAPLSPPGLDPFRLMRDLMTRAQAAADDDDGAVAVAFLTSALLIADAIRPDLAPEAF